MKCCLTKQRLILSYLSLILALHWSTIRNNVDLSNYFGLRLCTKIPHVLLLRLLDIIFTKMCLIACLNLPSINRTPLKGWSESERRPEEPVTHHGCHVSPFPGLPPLTPPVFGSTDHHRFISLFWPPGPTCNSITRPQQAVCASLAVSAF